MIVTVFQMSTDYARRLTQRCAVVPQLYDLAHLLSYAFRVLYSVQDFDGVFVDTEDAYDEGSPGVTDCPFGPGASYTYTLPLGTQTGTFWYHSQLSVQYVDVRPIGAHKMKIY